MINIIIDGLTDCLIERISGKEIKTVVEKLTENIEEKEWLFDWNREPQVFALKVKNDEKIQGLISLRITSNEVEIKLIESNKENIGKSGRYEGVGGNLIAFACKMAKDKGLDYIYFTSKTNLKTHYKEKIGAKEVVKDVMVIEGESFEMLIKKYFKEV